MQQRRHLSSLCARGKPWKPGRGNYTNLFWALRDKPQILKPLKPHFLHESFSDECNNNPSGRTKNVESCIWCKHSFFEAVLEHRIPWLTVPLTQYRPSWLRSLAVPSGRHLVGSPHSATTLPKDHESEKTGRREP